MDLERELSALRVAWPETPAFRYQRRRWPIAIPLAAALLAAVFAVPQSRGAILRFLHIGRVEIQFVSTLPAAQERPLGAGLGPVVTPSQARAELRNGGLLLPPLDSVPPLHSANGVVSFVFDYRGEEVLVSEIGFGGAIAVKKAVGGLTDVEPAPVRGNAGVWITGSQHVYIFPSVQPRLAGNVLVWTERGGTYRIEGANLTKAEALALAVRMR
jgi:hypothetical protein